MPGVPWETGGVTSASRDGEVAFWFATAGVACAAAFTIWALTGSPYSSGQTLLEANEGLLPRVAVATPIVAALLIWAVLHLACRRNSRAWRTAGRAGAWTVLAFSFLTGFTIGMAVVPVGVALLVAALMTPVSPRAAA